MKQHPFQPPLKKVIITTQKSNEAFGLKSPKQLLKKQYKTEAP